MTTEEHYEQVKRVLREALHTIGIAYDGPPLILACNDCGLPFRADIEMGMVAEHAKLEHGRDVDAGELLLDLVWVGEGPPPEPNRAQRRRK